MPALQRSAGHRHHVTALQHAAQHDPRRRARVSGPARAGALSDGDVARGRHPWQAARSSYQQGQQPSFRVSVVHGDLRYARYPIVVGHYEGDTIISAEASVDQLMRGALAQRYALGLYPGEFGSLAVILRKPTPLQKALRLPSGAIVMGLGKWGGPQRRTTQRPSSPCHTSIRPQRRDGLAAPADDVEATEPVGLSVLLIGGTSTRNRRRGFGRCRPPRDCAGESRTRRRCRKRLDHPGSRDRRVVRRHGDRGRACGQAPRSAHRQGTRYRDRCDAAAPARSRGAPGA